MEFKYIPLFKSPWKNKRGKGPFTASLLRRRAGKSVTSDTQRGGQAEGRVSEGGETLALSGDRWGWVVHPWGLRPVTHEWDAEVTYNPSLLTWSSLTALKIRTFMSSKKRKDFLFLYWHFNSLPPTHPHHCRSGGVYCRKRIRYQKIRNKILKKMCGIKQIKGMGVKLCTFCVSSKCYSNLLSIYKYPSDFFFFWMICYPLTFLAPRPCHCTCRHSTLVKF